MLLLATFFSCAEPTCDSGEKFNLDGLCVTDTGLGYEAKTDTDADTDADTDTDTDSGTDSGDSGADSGADTGDTAADSGADRAAFRDPGFFHELFDGAVRFARTLLH